MDIKEYIASGILENYVFGSVSAQERQEVECMSHIYPEIKTELSAIQLSIEKLALKAAVEPPAELKAAILSRIKNEPQDKAVSETPVIPLQPSEANRKPFYKTLAAASILCLVALGSYAYFLRSDAQVTNDKLASLSNELEAVKTDNSKLNTENTEVANQMAVLDEQMSFIRDIDTRKVPLNGTENYSDNLATVFWNQQNEKVLLDVKNLPESSANESYQLWVLIGGVPKDMGVFEVDQQTNLNGLMEMKATDLADAFAITREPRGGSESPTLDNLHVIGTI